MPEPRVETNPEAAASLGILDGDWVEAATATGRMRGMQDWTSISRRRWCARSKAGGNSRMGDANRLIDGDYFDPVGASNSLRHFPCDVRLSPARTDGGLSPIARFIGPTAFKLLKTR